MKSYLVIICLNSYGNLTKNEIRSSWSLLFALIWWYVPLLPLNKPYLPIFPLFTYIWHHVALLTLLWSCLPDLTKCVLLTAAKYYSIDTALLCTIWEQSDNYSWLRFNVLVIHKVLSRMQSGCLSSHWEFVVCTFWCFTHVSNFKEVGQLVMEILHFEDLGNTESAVTNAVVPVLGECQMSIATYLMGVYTII